MKKFDYYVKGLNTPESAELCQKVLKVVLPQASNVVCDTEGSRLSFSLGKMKASQNDIEQRLVGALATCSLELIPHEGVNNYTFVGDTPKHTRKMPVALAVALIAVGMVLAMLISFVACGVADNSGTGQVVNTTIVIEDDDIPDYIKELIRLDAIFKENSYDGIDEETMKEDLLINEPIDKVVMHYASVAKRSGLDGVVCSPLEAGKVHDTCGKSFVTVTPGVKIGRANLICAGAVVTKSTDDYAIMAGVPAKKIGEINPETGEYVWYK